MVKSFFFHRFFKKIFLLFRLLPRKEEFRSALDNILDQETGSR